MRRYRQQHAGDYFLGAYEQPQGSSSRVLIGYACATLTRAPTLTHDAMATHEPDGTHVAIHSVCVAPTHRHRGVASALLREYLARLVATPAAPAAAEGNRFPRIEAALLIAHPELVPLYERAGFTVVGPSAVVHGAKPWVELRREIRVPAAAAAPVAAEAADQRPGDAAAAREEGAVRSPGRLLAYFQGGMEDLVDPKNGTNKVNLYCPRAECRCLLLRAGAGTWVQGTKHDIEVRRARRFPLAFLLGVRRRLTRETSRFFCPLISVRVAPGPASADLESRSSSDREARLLVRLFASGIRKHRFLAQHGRAATVGDGDGDGDGGHHQVPHVCGL